VASPGFGVRGHDDRGAEGASIDAPKALSGVGYGERCAIPSRLGDLRERRELPQRGRGGTPAAIAFSACFRPQNASGSNKNTIILPKLQSTIEKLQIPLWKSGGDKSPQSHTKLRLCVNFDVLGSKMCKFFAP